MLTVSQYAEIVNSTIAKIKYPRALPGLYQPIEYAMASGGKRLRPVLLLAVNDAFGGETESAVWPAVGIEIFHNFTLVHDDVMDNADLRRGRPTVYKKWGLNTAILSGDTMVTLAYKCMSDCDTQYMPEIIDRFGQMAINVYEGQQIDEEFETSERVTFDQYLQMIIGKTSALIGYPCSMGAILAGASPKDVDAIFNFGIALGIAFQMQDDYLDVYGDPATFGKAIGGDILNDKKTWLHIITRDRDENGEFAALLGRQQTSEQKIEAVTAYYDKLNLRDEGIKLIKSYTDDAISYLNETSMSEEAKDWFRDLAFKLLSRDK